MARRYATASTVARGEPLDFVRPRHRMVLTTFRADGSLQASPVTGGVDEQGRLVIIDLPDAVEPLVDYFRAVAGEHPDWAEYRQAMVSQGKSLIRVTPERWGPVATGGFPPET